MRKVSVLIHQALVRAVDYEMGWLDAMSGIYEPTPDDLEAIKLGEDFVKDCQEYYKKRFKRDLVCNYIT